MTKATGRPRGRPKKVSLPVNPDELPATQGYVKCIARKTYDHKHHNDVQYSWTFFTTIIAWLTILAVGFMQLLVRGDRYGVYVFPSEIWYAIIAIAIVTTVVAADSYNTDNMDTCSPCYDETANKSIERWKPEKCEEKEC